MHAGAVTVAGGVAHGPALRAAAAGSFGAGGRGAQGQAAKAAGKAGVDKTLGDKNVPCRLDLGLSGSPYWDDGDDFMGVDDHASFQAEEDNKTGAKEKARNIGGMLRSSLALVALRTSNPLPSKSPGGRQVPSGGGKGAEVGTGAEQDAAIHPASSRERSRTPRSTRVALHPQPYAPTPCTLHPTPCTLHPTPYTLHPTPCTLHPAPCTLHPAPQTENAIPYTQNGKGLRAPRGSLFTQHPQH
ncbi:hypothetical protein T484DRAFT_2350562 [Baffinella frigidus]|nr:hypothetical protein T484DRAFT_2350562 [Cryptophyta sp. CCMP2293]